MTHVTARLTNWLSLTQVCLTSVLFFLYLKHSIKSLEHFSKSVNIIEKLFTRVRQLITARWQFHQFTYNELQMFCHHRWMFIMWVNISRFVFNFCRFTRIDHIAVLMRAAHKQEHSCSHAPPSFPDHISQHSQCPWLLIEIKKRTNFKTNLHLNLH